MTLIESIFSVSGISDSIIISGGFDGEYPNPPLVIVIEVTIPPET